MLDCRKRPEAWPGAPQRGGLAEGRGRRDREGFGSKGLMATCPWVAQQRGPAGGGVRVSGERADSECGCPSGGVGLGQRWGRGPGPLGAPSGRPEKPGQTGAGLGGDGVSWGQVGTLATRCREKCRDEEASTPRLLQPQSAGSLRARGRALGVGAGQPGTTVPGVPSARFRGGSAGPGSSYGVRPRRRGLRCIFHLFSAPADPAVAMGKRQHQKDKM